MLTTARRYFYTGRQERGISPLHWDRGGSLENFPEGAAFQLTLDEWAKGAEGSEGIQTEEESEQRPRSMTPSATIVIKSS